VRSGLPAMRHVLLEFPGWEGAVRADHVFLLGPALFVAPVLEPNATAHTCELPPGRWYLWEDGEVFVGPETFTVPAPLGEIPVFLRSGGIVPMLPDSVRRIEQGGGAPSGWSVQEVEASALEVVIGAGGESSIAMSDGTEISVALAGDLPHDATVRLDMTAYDLPACSAGQSPFGDDCWSTERDGHVVVVARSGPGEILFGDAVTGEPTRVRLTGGPMERRTLIRLYGEATADFQQKTLASDQRFRTGE